MPGVLVEAGFITNPAERNFMFSENGKSLLATSIFEAFKEYKKRIETKSSFTLSTNAESKINPTNNVKNEKQEPPAKPVIANSNIIYSVQISASRKKLDPEPSNFKGEKSVFRQDEKKISRYFSGRFATYSDAASEKNRLEKKFPDAFVVAFENGKLISVKNIPNAGN